MFSSVPALANRVNMSNLHLGRMATLGIVLCAEAQDNSKYSYSKLKPALLC
jgi:hypothetical protein